MSSGVGVDVPVYAYGVGATPVPPAVVTVTIAAPPAWGGVTTVSCSLLAAEIVAATPSNATPVATARCWPVIVTCCPPATSPVVGATVVMAGASSATVALKPSSEPDVGVNAPGVVGLSAPTSVP